MVKSEQMWQEPENRELKIAGTAKFSRASNIHLNLELTPLIFDQFLQILVGLKLLEGTICNGA